MKSRRNTSAMHCLGLITALLMSLLPIACGGGGGASHTVGGSLAGLEVGEVVRLQNLGGDDLQLSASGPYQFATALKKGDLYAVTVLDHPDGQNCLVANGSGEIGKADVTDVMVTCVDDAELYTVGGSLSGLGAGKSVTLQNSGGNDLQLSDNGDFTFGLLVEDGSDYEVTVLTQPDGQVCQVSNGTGSVAGQNVTDVTVACVDEGDTYSVGGALQGLPNGNSITLHNNGGDDLILSNDGSFTFATSLVDGSDYNVTVGTYPAGFLCTVTNGEGTIAGDDITDVDVTCVDEADAFTVGGSVTGLDDGKTVVLWLNEDAQMTIGAAGRFEFPTPLADGSDYRVTVLSPPAGQGCRVTNGVGTIAGTDVADVEVECNASGTFDRDFANSNGIALHDNAAGGQGNDRAYDVAADRYDRILVTGYSTNADNNADMAVWRYLPDGTLDPDFGNGGFLTVNNAAGGDSYDAGRDITVTPTGGYRIYVAGDSRNASGDLDMVVWRITEDGSLDSNFADNGTLVLGDAAGGDGDDRAVSIALTGVGNLAITGTSVNADGDTDMVLYRLRDDGFVFETIVHHDAAGGGDDDGGAAVIIDSNQQIVVAGHSRNAAGDRDMVLWGYTDQGNDLFLTTDENAAGGAGDDTGGNVAQDYQNKYIVAGSSANADGDADMVLWRYDASGETLDATFGVGGLVVDRDAAGGVGDDAAADVAVDDQGRIVVAGYGDNAAGDADLIVWRFMPDGSPDASFGPDGGVVVRNSPAGGMDRDIAFGLALDSQGRILVVGYSTKAGGDTDMVVMALVP